MATLDNGKKALNQLLEDINFSADVYYGSGWDLNFMKTNSDPSYRQFLDDVCSPVIANHGDLIMFDSRCIHATVDNHETTTRVSLDFRVMPVDQYESISVHRTSGGRSMRKFEKGDIYNANTISELIS
jgi:ectoine hydroxylase-related dioxygenase (phytanoyl-CoA dioxygenase family)